MSPLERFRRFPFWKQGTITLGSAAILIVLWSACGVSPPPPPPPLSAPRLELRGHYGSVLALAYSPNGDWLAAGTSDHMVRLWDVSKSEVLRTMKGHSDVITSLAVSPDGKIIASGSADKTAKLWDTSTGNEIRTLAGQIGEITAVVFSPDGRWLASSSSDKSIFLWEVSSGNQLQKLTGHTERVNVVAFSPDGRLLASASDDKTVRLWDSQSGKLVRLFAASNSPLISIAFSPDGKLLATGTSLRYGLRVNRQGEIHLWNPETGDSERILAQFFGTVRCLTFSPDGRFLASASEFAGLSTNSEIAVWDMSSHSVVSRWDAERSNQLFTIAYSPDGRWLASGGHSGRIRLWQ